MSVDWRWITERIIVRWWDATRMAVYLSAFGSAVTLVETANPGMVMATQNIDIALVRYGMGPPEVQLWVILFGLSWGHLSVLSRAIDDVEHTPLHMRAVYVVIFAAMLMKLGMQGWAIPLIAVLLGMLVLYAVFDVLRTATKQVLMSVGIV